VIGLFTDIDRDIGQRQLYPDTASIRQRLAAARQGQPVAVFYGGVFGLLAALVEFLAGDHRWIWIGTLVAVSQWCGFSIMIMVWAGDTAEQANTVLPESLTPLEPDALITKTRRHALRGVALNFTTVAALLTIALVTSFGAQVGDAVALGAAGGVFIAVRHLRDTSLATWVYYVWIRYRLARSGMLPWRLSQFLRWCCAPEREWMRASDAYEFRHRELLDHLSGTTSRVTYGRSYEIRRMGNV
jgi:hypothetical protein